LSINAPLIFGGQARHAHKSSKHALDRGATMVEVRNEAQQLWGEVIAEKSQYSPKPCAAARPVRTTTKTPDERKEPSVFATAYGGGPIEYLNLLETWRADGMRQDLEFRLSLQAIPMSAVRRGCPHPMV